MAEAGLPSWAARLRAERISRLWSQKVTAVRLRYAADEAIRARLPAVESIQRYVRNYEAGRHCPGDLYAELYCRAFGLTHEVLFGMPRDARDYSSEPSRFPTEQEAASLEGWLAITNASDNAVSGLADVALGLCEEHSKHPPSSLLSDVMRIHGQISNLLRAGKQRLWQTRDLYRIDAGLLAHASLLLGDLKSDRAAAAYGRAARLCAKEADANEATSLSVLAKTERWRLHFAESADLARRGYECSPPTPIRILLASQEANAAAFLGDTRRAREALNRAEDAACGSILPDSGTSAWSCPRPRQALFALSVAIQSGDPDAALRAAQMADSAWAAGDPWVAGTWAQVRMGAAIAYIMKGDLCRAQAEFVPAFTLAPEFRMATILGYTSQMNRRLQQRRFLGDDVAAEIREQIRVFNSAALSAHAVRDDS